MNNKQILIKHKATFNNSDRYKVIGLMDAARKEEAIAILNRLNESDYIKYEDGGYYHKDDIDGDNELTPEQLYELFKKEK